MAKQRLTAGEVIAIYLEKRGVDRIFGIPGAAILPTYDAIKEKTKIKSYVVRHEQMGAFMADGYSRATGKVGRMCGYVWTGGN